MDNELISKVKSDFKKSGFYAEMHVARAFVGAGWDVTVSPMYTDLDSHCDREYDLLAETIITVPLLGIEEPLGVCLSLCCEVKKSKYPWVILRKNKDAFEKSAVELNSLLFSCERSPVSENQTANTLLGHAPWVSLDWAGYGIHEAMKSPNSKSMSFQALTTACKAAREHFLRLATEQTPTFYSPEKKEKHELEILVKGLSQENHRANSSDGMPNAVMTRPVVVIDAPLLTVQLQSDGNLEVAEVEYGAVNFRFGTHQYRSKRYTVDVMTLNHLSSYLEAIKSSIDLGAEALASNIETPEPDDF